MGKLINKTTARLAVVAMFAAATANAAITVDLTTAGSSGTIGSATFQQTDEQPTGTGKINPFLRIESKGNEAGYNTSGDITANFDVKNDNWERDVLLSSVPVVNGSYQFLLDINEPGNDTKTLLSLNQLQIFLTGTPGQTGGSWNKADGRFTPTVSMNLVYDMNPGGGTDNKVSLNASLNSGSGSGDMFLYIPTSLFDNVPGQYVILYSQFGNPPGTSESDSGFEEWATIAAPAAVPEPSTMIAGALLLLPFGASTLRALRKNKAA